MNVSWLMAPWLMSHAQIDFVSTSSCRVLAPSRGSAQIGTNGAPLVDCGCQGDRLEDLKQSPSVDSHDRQRHVPICFSSDLRLDVLRFTRKQVQPIFGDRCRKTTPPEAKLRTDNLKVQMILCQLNRQSMHTPFTVLSLRSKIAISPESKISRKPSVTKFGVFYHFPSGALA